MRSDWSSLPIGTAQADTNEDTASVDSASSTICPRQTLCRVGRGGLVALVVLLFATQPVAAQADNPVCQDSSETLADMIEGFLQITVGLGVMGLLVVWQADSLMSMFRLPDGERSRLKQHRRAAGKSAVTLVVLGPLFAVAGSAMDLPVAQCVDLIPF